MFPANTLNLLGRRFASTIGNAMIDPPVSPQSVDSYIKIGIKGQQMFDPSGKPGLSILPETLPRISPKLAGDT